MLGLWGGGDGGPAGPDLVAKPSRGCHLPQLGMNVFLGENGSDGGHKIKHTVVGLAGENFNVLLAGCPGCGEVSWGRGWVSFPARGTLGVNGSYGGSFSFALDQPGCESVHAASDTEEEMPEGPRAPQSVETCPTPRKDAQMLKDT